MFKKLLQYFHDKKQEKRIKEWLKGVHNEYKENDNK